jgi:hypothetical protein
MDNSYQKFFKYINFFIAYILSFLLMYKSNLELLGVGISFIINMVSQLFLFIDLSLSPKSKDIIVLLLSIGIIITFICNTIVVIKLRDMHTVFSRKEMPIRFDKEDRKLFDRYKILYITIVMLIGVSSFFFFSLFKNPDNTYEPYFNFNFDTLKNRENSLYIILQLGMQFLKISMAGAILGIGGYMIWLSLELAKINTSRIYIPEKVDDTANKSIFEKRSPAFSMAYDIYRNLNLNYLTESRPTVNL